MDDLIRRSDAIDLVEELETKRLRGQIDLTYPKTIKGLKTLSPAQQWIPCSERLPEIDVFVLVTLQHFNGETDVVIAKVVKGYSKKGLEWESDDGEWTWGIEHGFAWMPLPEAWKGEK